MNRIVKQDYERLVEYFSLYNLKEVCTDTAFLEQLKTLHRKLYAYLLFLREAEDTNYYSNSTVTSYYDEAGSDLIFLYFAGLTVHINLPNSNLEVVLKIF